MLIKALQVGIQGDKDFNTLIRKLYLFEYRAPDERWFSINPVLAETEKYRQLIQDNAAPS